MKNRITRIVAILAILIIVTGIAIANVDEKSNKNKNIKNLIKRNAGISSGEDENDIYMQVCCIPSEFDIYQIGDNYDPYGSGKFNLPVRVQVYNGTLRPYRGVNVGAELNCDNHYYKGSYRTTKSSGVVLFKFRVPHATSGYLTCNLHVSAETYEDHWIETSYYQIFRVKQW